MVTTRGFGIDVLPQFAGVDPSLVTLNPERLQSGALSSLQIADTVNKIRAHQALQAEIEATRAARINAQNAQGNLTAATDTAALGNVSALANLTGATAASGLRTLPSAEAEKIATSQARTGEAGIQLATQPSKLELAKIQTAGEAGRAQAASDIADIKQQTEGMIADLDNKYKATVDDLTRRKVIKDLREDIDSDPTSLPEIQKAHLVADSKLKDAQAALALAKPSIEEKKIAERLQASQIRANAANHHDSLARVAETAYNNAQTALDRLGNQSVENLDPNTKDDKPEIKLSALISSAFNEVDGKLVPKAVKGKHWWSDAVKAPENLPLINEYQRRLNAREQAAGLHSKSMSALDRLLSEGSTDNTQASPDRDTSDDNIWKVHTLDDAKELRSAGEIKDGDPIIVNGRKGIWRD